MRRRGFAALPLLLPLLATGCESGRAAPRLVAAPPLPPSGIIVDLSGRFDPTTSDPATNALGERQYALPIVPGDDDTVADRVTVARGGVEIQCDLSALYTKTGLATPASRSASMIAIDRLVGRAVVIDFRERVASDLDEVFDVEDLDEFEKRSGMIEAGDFVLLRTGYDVIVPDLRDVTRAWNLAQHGPGMSREVMRVLVVERGVRRVGTDAPRLSPVLDSDHGAESVLFEKGGFGVVRLANLDRLPTRGATLVALPLALSQAGFAPARAIAVVPAESSD